MAHAETVVMSMGAISLEQKRLWDCTLFVTLEPCTMCAAAISMMRIKRLVFGAENPKGGAVVNGVKFFESPTCNHKPIVTSGVLAEECGEILSDFFKKKR
jgi:tRNA(Arg) A34 adenosine deaminase TadA